MMTRYAGKSSRPRYYCEADRVNYAAARCQGLAARALDDEAVGLALRALTPSALEVSLRVAEDLQGQFEQAQGHWCQRLERARFEADRARRQYDAVEPENRLVARTLEAAWERKLAELRELTGEHERFLRQQPRAPGDEERAEIRRLAADLPALWSAPSTTDADRKEILRQVIEEVVVTVEGQTEWCEALVRWAGGGETRSRFRRPVARLEQLADGTRLRGRIAELRGEGLTTLRIAERLDAEGLRGAEGGPITASAVGRLVRRYGLARRRPATTGIGRGEWLVPDLARQLAIPPGTVYSWARRGVVGSRRIGEGGHGRLVITGLGSRPDLESIRRHLSNGEVGGGPSTRVAQH
jgi:hypothetical protein